MTLPRKYVKDSTFPLVCFVMANEMVAARRCRFREHLGLAGLRRDLNEFAWEEIKAKYLPLVSRGATCAMDLTEPDAGSDLRAVMLQGHVARGEAARGCSTA